MLLSSSMPFYGKSRNQVIKKIIRGRFHFSSRRWKHVSEEAISFVRTLLQTIPTQRPTAEEAMKLPCILNRLKEEEISIYAEAEMMDSIQGSIQAFSRYRALKKLGTLLFCGACFLGLILLTRN
jgi:calcium-dependent protein kinase